MTEPTTESPSQRSAPADPLRGSRTSSIWLFTVMLGVLLLLLIIFIAQNTRKVEITFLVWSGQAPLAVSLMAATAAGIFLVVIAGSLRILQLRRRVRRHEKHATTTAPSDGPAA